MSVRHAAIAAIIALLPLSASASSLSVAVLDGEQARMQAQLTRDQRPAATDPEALPDGRVATGSGNDIDSAWYVLPTTRYGHGVLGDRIEAGGLRVRGQDGATLTLVLPETEVFEDITPRLVDLDRDGRDEIVTLLASTSLGGSVAVFGVRQGAIRKLAQTPFIGRANRWLNIASLTDMTGNGRGDIAVVRTPHIGGQLQLYAFSGDALTLIAAEDGFSNHVIGDRELRLSAIGNLAGDGTPSRDLAVPSADRWSLRVMRHDSGGWIEIGSVAMPAPITGPIRNPSAASVPARFHVGLADNRFAVVTAGGR